MLPITTRIAFLSALLFLLSNSLAATTLDSIVVKMTIDSEKNVLHIRETYHQAPDQEMPAWYRVVFHEGIVGMPMLYQRLENLKLEDQHGTVLEVECYKYGLERTGFEYKGGVKGTVVLTYDILHPFDGTNAFGFKFRYYDFDLAAYRIKLYVEVPDGVEMTKAAWEVSYYDSIKDGEFGYGEDIEMGTSLQPNLYDLTLNVAEEYTSFYEPSLEGTFRFKEALVLPAPTDYKEEWQAQGGNLLWIVLGSILLAILLRFFPVSIFPQAIRAYGLLLFGLAFWTGMPLYVYFWKAVGFGENFFIEFMAQMLFLASFAVIAYTIHLNLKKRNAQAYYAVLAFPILFFVFLGPASVNPIMYLLIPMAFTPMLFWFQKKNATYLGANYYKWVEQVETAGKISFEELSQQSNLPAQRLIEIFEQIPHHPIYIDFEARTFLSASAIALQQKHLLCTNCGAATEIKNEDLFQCNHCHTAYRESRTKKPSKPIPEMVAVAAGILTNLGIVLFIFCALMGIALLGETLFKGFEDIVMSIVTIVVVCGLFGGVGLALIASAEALEKGENDSSKWVLLLLFIFITPLYIWYRLGKDKRIQLHFDKTANQTIDAFVQQKGTVSIDELAKHLGIQKKEALEVADYLCGNNLIQAVFDVEKNQLVHRTVWEKLSGANSCGSCGGLVQLKVFGTECMHCGA